MKVNSMRRQLLVFCGLFLMFGMVHAAPPQWMMIPAESKLTFTATQNNAPVTGEFKTFSADIFVDPEDLTVGSIDIVIDIGSLNASYADLKDTLVTADWFDTKAFPKAKFRASQFKQTGRNTYEATGTLTIRDKSAPVTLKFTAEESAPNKKIVLGSTVIKRSTFGVGRGEWSGTEEIKDEVTVNFKVAAIRKE
jgi:polyisoprenoid-binding protein YceI